MGLSLLVSAVEFYSFFVYATAAALVFGPLYFPAASPLTQSVGAWASFALAFFARPLGAVLFGHLGDRRGRREALTAAMLLMAISTASIGLLPDYAHAGWIAPALLGLLRFGQGLGLGGQWGGAALLAVENAPEGRKGLYGATPQLGAPLGFVAANGAFLGISLLVDQEEFFSWGWRIPFLAAAPLMIVAFGVGSRLRDTTASVDIAKTYEPAAVPIRALLDRSATEVMLGILGIVSCFVLYYMATAFMLEYSSRRLGYTVAETLMVQICTMPFMAAGTLLSGWLSDRWGTDRMLLAGALLTIPTGLLLAPSLQHATPWIGAPFVCASMLVLGIMYGPLGSWLPSLFPAQVRYTGTSLTFHVAGVIGGALTPLLATLLTASHGLHSAGLYLSAAGVLSFVSVAATIRR
ncbi:MFS transporter [Methylorubrum extorquens]|uniref:MFS transporter n=1 Tax=Methylorubrum extorquens TaxID=408 RepID=A0A1S1NXW8_METEX|nr:MFS transporter [Methylorubrum extorquens]